MQRIVEELRSDLSAFVEQRDALTLVLWAKGPSDFVYAHQLLDSMDQASSRDVYILFADDFYDIERYVDSFMAACDQDIDIGNEAIARGLGDDDVEPWPGLPAACFDGSLRPVARIQALIAHLRTRMPDPTNRIVLAFLPSGRLSDPEGYQQLAVQLIPWGGYEPWMAGVRIILRDTQQDARIVRGLAADDAFGTLVRPLDFSTDALSQALVDTVDDETAPPEERMSAFVQVAALDQAWGRHDEAVGKYGVANAYYTETGNLPMQCLCILQAGHAEERAGRREKARLRFQQALQLSMDNDVKQVTLNSLLALAQMHHADEDWSAAAEYWEATVFFSRALNSLFVFCDACQQGGVCQVALNDTDKALEFWETGKTVAGQIEYWERQIATLTYMIELEGRVGRDEERAAHEDELRVSQEEMRYQQQQIAHARHTTGAGGAS